MSLLVWAGEHRPYIAARADLVFESDGLKLADYERNKDVSDCVGRSEVLGAVDSGSRL